MRQLVATTKELGEIIGELDLEGPGIGTRPLKKNSRQD